MEKISSVNSEYEKRHPNPDKNFSPKTFELNLIPIKRKKGTPSQYNSTP